MTPDTGCGNCGHALKWHHPCSKCGCNIFVPKGHKGGKR